MSKQTIKAVVLLIGTYIMAQAIADVGATKFVEIGGIVMPGGTFIFALTFTLRDMIHKRLGKEWARTAIFAAAGLNVMLAGYVFFLSRLSAPDFFALSDSWNAIFSIVPAITIGSIISELVSELTDTEVYQFWKTRFPRLPQWSRVLASNAVSLPIDSIVFTFLAFVLLPPLFGAESISFADAFIGVASGQIVFKAIVTVISLPLIYTVKDERLEGIAAFE